MSQLLISRSYHPDAQRAAQAHGLPFIVAPIGYEPPYERALLVECDAITPLWDMAPFGLRFVERWDLAAPLWRYSVLACDIGTEDERAHTRSIVRDLRVPLYAYELLFVQDSPIARDFLACWQAESQGGSERRLAFLRAMYQTKPRLCPLPRGWLQIDAPAAMSAKAAAVGDKAPRDGASDIEKRAEALSKRYPRQVVRVRGNDRHGRR